MAKPIAEAFIELDARTAKYKQKIADMKRRTARFGASATKALGAVAKSLKVAALGMGAFGAAAAVAAAVVATKLTRSMFGMVRAAVKMGDEFDKMALRTGESVEMLTALSFAAQISGTSIQDMETGIRRLSRNMNDVSRGIGEARRSFEKLDVSVADSQGRLRSASSVISEIADKMNNLTSESEKTAVAQEIFGRGGASLLPLLKQGSAGIKALTDRAAELGLVLSTKTAAAAAEFNDRMTELRSSIEMIKFKIGTALLPILQPLVERFTVMSSEISGVVDKLALVIGAYKDYGKEVTMVLEQVALIGLKTTLAMLSGMFKMIQIAGKNMFEPLLFGGITVFNELNRRAKKASLTISKWLSKLAPKEFETTNEQLEKQKKAVDEYIDGLNNMSDALGQMAFMEGMQKGLAEGTNVIKDAMQDYRDMMKDVNTVLDAFISKHPKVEATIEETVKPVQVLKRAFTDWGFILDQNIKAVKKLGGTIEGTAKDGREEWNRLLDQMDMSKAVREANRAKEAIEEFKEKAKDTADAIKPAFENMFVDLLSGKTKDLWTQFWDDLKQIAIRKLAEIAATTIFTKIIDAMTKEAAKTKTDAVKSGVKKGIGGVIGGFVGSIFGPGGTVVGAKIGSDVVGAFGEGGIVRKPTFAMIGEKGPEAVIPLSGPRASGMGRPFIFSGDIIFNETDFANMDRTRLKKTVQQQIIPLLREAAADGI